MSYPFSVAIFEDERIGEHLLELVARECRGARVLWYKELSSRPLARAGEGTIKGDKLRSLDELTTFDVIILDMKIEGDALGEAHTGQYLGEDYLVENYTKFTARNNIYIYTGFGPETHKVDELILPCWKDPRKPYIGKWDKAAGASKESELVSFVKRQIYPLYQAKTQGWSPVEFRAIRFAAEHDLPVLIVGESGTGKELVANMIYSLWRQGLDPTTAASLPERIPAINCAGLHPELARNELFGHVRGAYSGAESHALGLILSAAGLRPPADPPNHQTTSADFFRRVLAANAARVLAMPAVGQYDLCFAANVENGGVKRTQAQQPVGSLFLDEFGDLPGTVQSLVLRYLNNFELQPLNYDGAIHGAKLRIVAATSDSRIAALAGYDEEFLGLPRSSEMFRQDLFYRVAGQVIRVHPLGPDEAVELIEFWSMDKPDLVWTKEAKKRIWKRVDDQTRAVSQARTLHSFGHRRELRRVFDLICEWARSAEACGIRRATITEELVDFLWRPAKISDGQGAPAGEGLPKTAPKGFHGLEWVESTGQLRRGAREIARLHNEEEAIMSMLWRSPERAVTVEAVLGALGQKDSQESRHAISQRIYRINGILQDEGLRIDSVPPKRRTKVYQLVEGGPKRRRAR